ncbi:MAG: hypothetical protein JW751_08525 [Polyangiaceae bacterium]|nr:hypothetical protein [Polyangiaceae bacterium]
MKDPNPVKTWMVEAGRRGARLGFALASLGLTTPALAAPDGVYGRFDGDLDLGIGAGAQVGSAPARLAVRGTAHYYGMAGLGLTYLEPLAASHPRGRTLLLATDLRPLFVPRWSNALERGPAFLDLALDALSVGVGVYFATGPEGPLGRQRGLEWSLGAGLPLLARAAGPWLEARGALLWNDGARDPSPPAEASAYLLLTWHGLVLTPFR